uniref:Uncharacterized protein n=1 Tax=Parascaris univalens TaxID=6257 RepID=A0A914ZZV3_PARUN
FEQLQFQTKLDIIPRSFKVNCTLPIFSRRSACVIASQHIVSERSSERL